MENTDVPSVGGDLTLATILTLCIAISIPLNLVAIVYFWTQNTGRKNGVFFNRLYMMVAGTDSLICLLQLPTIDSLFHRRRSREWLFDNHYFCMCWAALNETSVVLSIFLVALLSICRLILLKYPSQQLPPYMAPIILACFIILHCVVIPPLFSIDYLNARPSESGNFMCYLCGNFETTTEMNETYIGKDDLVRYLIVQSVRSSLAGFPFFPILLSFCISMILLKRSKRRVGTTASVKRQDKASGTIILFTSVYVVCNVPLTIYVIYLTSLVANLVSRANKIVTNRITLSEYGATFSGSYFERHYVWIIGINLSTVLNSTLNPILYIWRMKNFRDFLISKRTTFRNSIISSNYTAKDTGPASVENISPVSVRNTRL